MKKQQVKNMKRIKRLLPRLTNHLLHIIMGAYLVSNGLILIFSDNYYSWPPNMAPFYNSDFVGSWALFTGLGLIYVAIQKEFPSKANIIWLLSACGFLGFTGFLEFAHGIVFHNIHMLDYSITLIFMLLINFYIIDNNTASNHKNNHKNKLDVKLEEKLEERDKKTKRE